MDKLVDISFQSPGWFLLGLAVPLMIWWYIKRYKRNQVTLVYAAPPVVKIRKSFKQRTIHFPFILRMLALVLFITAMARPQGFLGNEERDTEGIDIVFVLDVSYSMVAKDLEPTRLEVAKSLMIKFIKSRKHDRFGLVTFGTTAVSKTPLTLDHRRLMDRIAAIQPGPGEMGFYTAIGLGLGTAVARLESSEAKSKVIVLVTDGVNNAGEISPMVAAELAASYGIRVYIIGVGTRGMAEGFGGLDFNGNIIYEYQKVEIDEVELNKMADKTNGKYFRATDNNSLENIFREIDVLEKSKLKTKEIINKPDKFFWLVLLGGLLFMLEICLRLTYYRSII